MSETVAHPHKRPGLYRESVNGINNGFLFGCGCCLFVAILALIVTFGPIFFAGWFVTSVVKEVNEAQSKPVQVVPNQVQKPVETPTLDILFPDSKPDKAGVEGESVVMITPPDTREGLDLLLQGPPQPRPATPEEINQMKEAEKQDVLIQRTLSRASTITAGMSYDSVTQRLGADGYVVSRATVNGKRFNTIEWSIGPHTLVVEFADGLVTESRWK